MKNVRIYVLVLLAAVAVPPLVQRRALALTEHSPHSVAASNEVQTSALRIISPQPGQKIAQKSLFVEYEQVSPKTAARAFEVRLDRGPAVRTADSSHTFDGLTAGPHTLVVQAVDAKNRPVPGMRSEISFEAVNSAVAATAPAVFSTPSAPPLPSSNDLPSGSSSLPLLSVIGFGILVGGVISALRTRPAHK